MKNSVKSPAKVQLVQQLAAFLDSQAAQPRESANCENCGAGMQGAEFQFWLAGTRLFWNVRLPLCPRCAQPTVDKSLGSVRAAPHSA